MAHRTRKKLTKTELKRDPVGENLMKGWFFVRGHLKEVAVGCAVLLLLIVVGQSIVNTRRQQNADAMAQYLLAEMIFEQSEQLAVAGRNQDATGALTQVYALASDVYSRNQNRSWGRRAAILAAKAGILLGREDEVIETMQQLLAARPERLTRLAANLHLAVALENRGGIEDLNNARIHYAAILPDSARYPVIASEAMTGLSRLAFAEGDLAAARGWLEGSLEMKRDTTGYESYLLARLEQAEQTQ